MKGMKKLEIKYKIKQALKKFVPVHQFNYKYKPFSIRTKARNFIVSKNRQISIASVVIFLLFFSYIITNSVTGYMTYQKSIETELNDTRNELTATKAELNSMTASKENCDRNLQDKTSDLTSCNNKLSESSSYLVNCESERNELRTYTDELNALFSTCEEERNKFQSNYEDISAQFDATVEKTASDVCCRPGIEISDWGIVDNRIVCSGEFTINCSSGETNY